MKTILTICLSFAFLGQNSFKINAQASTVFVIPNISSELVLPDPQNGFTMFGRDIISASAIIRFDSMGNITWNRAYQLKDSITHYYSRFNAAVVCIDSGYAATGSILKNNYNLGYGFVLRVKANGDTLWSRKIVLPGFDYVDPQGITQCKDSGIVICGTAIISNTPTTSDRRMFVAKLLKNGTLAFFKTIQTNAACLAYSIKQCPDSGYIIGGSWNGCTSLLKLSSGFSVQWAKNYCFQGSTYNTKAQNLLIVPGGYLFCNDKYPVSLVKTDLNGNMLWKQSYDGSYYNQYNYQKDLELHAISGKRFLLSHGSEQNLSGSFSIVCDSLGNPLWENNTMMQNSDFIQLKNKRFVCSGGRPYFISKNSSTAILYGGTAIVISDSLAVSTSSCFIKSIANTTLNNISSINTYSPTFVNMGSISSLQPTLSLPAYSFIPGCHELGTGISEATFAKVQMYPNPCRDEIHLEFTQLQSSPIRFEIYTLSGELVKSELIKMTANNCRILLTELPSAFYLYRVYSGFELLKVGKLIRE